MMLLDREANPKLRKTKVELVLKPIDDKKPKDCYGMTDTRIFTGKNKLWAIMDEKNCLWYLRYEYGATPASFKQRFTTMDAAVDFVRGYFSKRNIQIVDVLD